MALSTSTVHSRLRDTAQKVRLSQSSRWLLGACAAAVLILVGFLLLDAWLHFAGLGRWTGFAMVMGALVAGGVLAVRAWKMQPSEEAVARRIENAAEGSSNELISAVQFDRELPASSKLRAALFREMRDPFPQVKWDVVFDSRLLKRLGIALGVALAGMFAWAVIAPGYFTNSVARILLPAAKIDPLTRTRMLLEPGKNDLIAHGRAFEVKAFLSGSVPKSAWVNYRENGSGWQKVLMQHIAGKSEFGFEWKEVKQPIEYYVEAGDATSATYHLDVRPRTAIQTKSAEVQPPAYTGLKKSEVQDFSVLQQITPGSEVTMHLEFNNSLTRLSATDGKNDPVIVERVGEKGAKLVMKPVANQTIRFSFSDDFLLTDSATVQVGVKPDEAPAVTVTQPVEGAQVMAAKGAKVLIQFRAEDAFGLGSVELFESSDQKEDAVLVQSFPDAVSKQHFEGAVQIAVPSDRERVTYRLVAKDRNDVTGPGITMSRPIVINIESRDKLEKAMDETVAKLTQGIEALIRLQETNLQGTKVAAERNEQGTLGQLVTRQVQISDGAKQLLGAAGVVSPDVREQLAGLSRKEMPEAIVQLRNADAAKGPARERFLTDALVSQAIILARLQGAPAVAQEDKQQQEIAEIIHGVEDLLKKERDLLKDTKAGGDPAGLSERQDALADKAVAVRQSLDKDSKNPSVGDAEFRARLGRVAAMFGETRIYEDMLSAAEKLSSKQVPGAVEVELRVVNHLAKLVELLNQWQLADAAEKAEDMKKKVQDMEGKLEKLAEIQREILEKTKDIARKSDFRPEDVATAKEFQEQKDLMKDVLEQLTTDLQAFPETKSGNEMKGEIVSIFEDVQQADKQDVADGKLKPQEIAVQKEQGILDGIEQAKKIAADMEMWLPSKTETQKWVMENFDKQEMPEIPMLPLADAFEDLVGNLMDEQQDINDEIQDPASNQAFAMNPANGWEVRDGPMPGFGAQGRSGNERPNHNEQMGRSSGGREGMSDGEMAGGKAQNLEGDTPTTRRTRDAMQQGQVEDEGGIGKTRATGGGKAAGFSDRQGMEGNAPLRATQAAARPTDAAAAAQAQLSEKTAKKVAEANLLYIRGGEQLAPVARLMDENAQAIREGRMKDSAAIHQKIMARLKELKGGVSSGEVVAFAATDGARADEKQLLGGQEGEVPAQYKDQVADYFRALVEEK